MKSPTQPCGLTQSIPMHVRTPTKQFLLPLQLGPRNLSCFVQLPIQTQQFEVFDTPHPVSIYIPLVFAMDVTVSFQSTLALKKLANLEWLISKPSTLLEHFWFAFKKRHLWIVRVRDLTPILTGRKDDSMRWFRVDLKKNWVWASVTLDRSSIDLAANCLPSGLCPVLFD